VLDDGRVGDLAPVTAFAVEHAAILEFPAGHLEAGEDLWVRCSASWAKSRLQAPPAGLLRSMLPCPGYSDDLRSNLFLAREAQRPERAAAATRTRTWRCC